MQGGKDAGVSWKVVEVLRRVIVASILTRQGKYALPYSCCRFSEDYKFVSHLLH